VANRLVVHAARERVEAWRPALASAGYEIAEAEAEPDLIVLALTDASVDLVGALASGAPVLGVVGPEAWEQGMRAAIEGAARCIAEPDDPGALVAAVDAVLGPDAPPIAEQRQRARQRALTLLARFEACGAASDDDDQPRSVHLTRLEHQPGAESAAANEAASDARRRLTTLTTKQRGLLHVVEAEGSVAAAAARLGTSRGNVYAGLRRIVHRLGVRDTAELLRLVVSGELLRAARS
jgi:DNA-binding NarL/FixJ family response regulator